MLCSVTGKEVDEHLLQPNYQLALQLLLQATVLGPDLAARVTGKDHFWLVREQPKQLVCNDKARYKETSLLRFAHYIMYYK